MSCVSNTLFPGETVFGRALTPRGRNAGDKRMRWAHIRSPKGKEKSA